jgi:hypothetical protein
MLEPSGREVTGGETTKATARDRGATPGTPTPALLELWRQLVGGVPQPTPVDVLG